MTSKKSASDYWFVIDPYVYMAVTKKCSLLYNTLDGNSIESHEIEVINLLKEILQENNHGVVLLKNGRYKQKEIQSFIHEIREKFMGDIIDVSLSQCKPVQIMPYFNYPNKRNVYKKQNLILHENILENISEINIYLDSSIDTVKLIHFLESIPPKITLNIIGNIENIINIDKLLIFFQQYTSTKNLIYSYKEITFPNSTFTNLFTHKVHVSFPVDKQKWNKTMQLLLEKPFPVEYIFEVTSLNDYKKSEHIIEHFHLEKYNLKPIYTGSNIDFFKEYIFLTRKDILSTTMSIKDFFIKQSMNSSDFGKISIMPNGDAYGNIHHPVLGNIYKHSITEIIQKEINEGVSWFRVRDKEPCNTCIYQWLCPSPSDYEIEIGYPNLCYVI